MPCKLQERLKEHFSTPNGTFSSQLYEFVEFIGEWGGYVEVLIGGSVLNIVLWLTRIIDGKIKAMEDRAIKLRVKVNKIKSKTIM